MGGWVGERRWVCGCPRLGGDTRRPASGGEVVRSAVRSVVGGGRWRWRNLFTPPVYPRGRALVPGTGGGGGRAAAAAERRKRRYLPWNATPCALLRLRPVVGARRRRMAIHSGVPLLAGWVAGLRCSSPLPCLSLSPMANVSGITRQQPLCMYGSAREAFVGAPPPHRHRVLPGWNVVPRTALTFPVVLCWSIHSSCFSR